MSLHCSRSLWCVLMMACASLAGGCGVNHFAPQGKWMGPNSGHGSCSIKGRAFIIMDNGESYHAAGHLVEIFPKTPATTQFINEMRRAADRQEPNVTAPPEVIERGRRVYGYGLGSFEMTDLPPGEYYLLFRLDGVRPADAEVTLAPGQHLENVVVSRKSTM